MKDDLIESPKLAFTVAAPTPIRCKNAEQVVAGQQFSEEILEKLAEAVAEDVRPRDSWRAGKAFRLHIIKTLAKNVTRRAVNNHGGTC
jgi:xanthine dehydrogenase FAD-binding subunit